MNDVGGGFALLVPADLWTRGTWWRERRQHDIRGRLVAVAALLLRLGLCLCGCCGRRRRRLVIDVGGGGGVDGFLCLRGGGCVEILRRWR
jgi:hypothetical protein